MAFGSGTSTKGNSSTGNNNIDGLIANRSWASNTVTFSFTSSIWDYESGYPNRSTHASSFQSLNATQRTVARDWMEMYEDVSGLNLVELTGSNDRHATIRMAESSDPSTAYAYYPSGSVQGGDIWFNRTSYNNPVMGNYAYHTFGHEIGHALGLKHGHETGGVRNVAMNANRDSMEFSIMTYRSYEGDPLSGGYSNETYGYAQSLMMYDIAAVQRMYGANFGHNSGNSFYTFSTNTGEMFINGVGQGTPGANRIFRTVWDGNGTDTYSFTNYTNNLSINLAPGGWSDLDVGGNDQRAYLGDGNYARGHVFNALQFNGDRRSLIENAYGGTGNDRIYGNAANNYLWGNDGNDSLYGYDGNDTLSGGNGNDYMNGGNGNDYMYGGNGNDRIYGGEGSDRIYAGAGNDYVNGGGGDDFMDGGSGIDTVDYGYWHGGGTYNLATGVANFPGYYTEEIRNFENIYTGNGVDNIIGTSGDNFISSGGGNDYVSAGSGHDRVYSGSGNDRVYAGSGNDYVSSSSGNDIIYGQNGNDRVYAGSGNDYVNGGSGNDYIYGQSGNDTLIGGTGNDYIVGGGYSYNSNERDTLTSSSYSDSDRFVLGNSSGSFYRDNGFLGFNAYAEITDFDEYNYSGDVSDKLVLYGSSSNYYVSTSSGNSYLYHKPTSSSYDLIAVVDTVGNTGINLNEDAVFV